MVSTSLKDDEGFKGLFPIGTLIHSRYEILAEGKMGGMGMVYKCRDIRHGRLRDVALKLMQPKLLASREAVERFRHEASISRDLLHHQNIVRVYHDDEWQDESGVVWYYLLMEWIEGRSLRDLIEERKKAGRPFTTWEAYRIISQLAGALSYAHGLRERVIHRDVKPENIIFTDETTLALKLADFGIAKLVTPGDPSRVNTLIGISPYMSPELREGSPFVDQRTDIYSTGVVLYELFTLDSTIGPYCPSELNKTVPREMDAIYKRAVAPRVEQRYDDVRTLSADLLSEAKKGDLLVRGMEPGTQAVRQEVPARKETRGRTKGIVIALVTALLLAGTVVAYVGYQSRFEEILRSGRAGGASEQEKARKKAAALEEKKKKEEEAKKQAELKKQAEARKAREKEEKEQRARAEEKAKKQAAEKAKATQAGAAPKEDISDKIRRWQKQLNLAKVPDVKSPPRTAKQGASASNQEARKEPEAKKPASAPEEVRTSHAREPGLAEERKVTVPRGSTADVYFQKGIQLMKDNHLIQAAQDFSRAIEIDPGHELSYYWRGVTYYKLRSHSKALSDFTNAIRLRQNDLYYHWRGVTYFRLNNYYMAINDFTQALRMKPNNIDYRWRGACWHKLGRQAEAESDFAMASRFPYERGPVRNGSGY